MSAPTALLSRTSGPARSGSSDAPERNSGPRGRSPPHIQLYPKTTGSMQARCRKRSGIAAVLSATAICVAGSGMGPLKGIRTHPWPISLHPCPNTLNPSTRPVLLATGTHQGTELLAMPALCVASSRCALWQFQILLFAIARFFPRALGGGWFCRSLAGFCGSASRRRVCVLLVSARV